MGEINPKTDIYIAKAQPFAQPMLEHIRKLVHSAVPDMEETIKWGFPFFTVNGKPVAHMAAFKEHAAFGLWGDAAKLVGKKDSTMGLFGKLTSLKDLPPAKELTRLMQIAAESARSGKTKMRSRPKPKAKAEIAMHPEFAAALRKSKKAEKIFAAFPPGAQREYLEWIVDAKRDATRIERIATAVNWIAEGKKRNWKYEK